MAEQIISPGVFTRENDLSFLPAGVGAIGAAVIGPTVKGPAFIPTVVNSFAQYERRFGPLSSDTFVPQTVREYLKNAGSITVVRVLAGGGYTVGGSSGISPAYLVAGYKGVGNSPVEGGFKVEQYMPKGIVLGVLYPSKDSESDHSNKPDLSNTEIRSVSNSIEITGSLLNGSFNLILSGSEDEAALCYTHADYDGVDVNIMSASMNPTAVDYIPKQLGYTPDNSKTSTTAYGGVQGYTYLNFKDLQTQALATSMNTGTALNGTTVDACAGYPTLGSHSLVFVAEASGDGMSYTGLSGTDEKYSQAYTPWITSGLLGTVHANKTVKNLFKVHTLNHGTSTNKDYKISIANLKEPADIDGKEQYSMFSVILRKYTDTDKNPVILEQYNNCTLDPNDSNYIARKIGDRYPLYNDTLNKVEMRGNYPNISQHIRIEVDAAVAAGSTSPKLSPKGFAAIDDPINTSAINLKYASFPSASYEVTQSVSTDNVYNSKGYLGWRFPEKAEDNDNWMRPLPATTQANISGRFNVDNCFGHTSSSLWAGDAGVTTGHKSLSASIDSTGANGPTNSQLKFSVPFQGGSDGVAPWTPIWTGAESIGTTEPTSYASKTNLFGFDLSTTAKAGYKGYKKAIDILSNQDEYDINMLAIPGVLKEYHPLVTSAAVDMVEERGDCFYVMDLNIKGASVNSAVSTVSGLDTNYAAVYYPWVKVLDTAANRPVFVPPSVIVPGAIAASDRIGAEWFAPAGLNRGILGNVLEAKIRLNQAERDTLYDAKINPIATFPQTGVCIWGQKTLQERSTALDRINVRRLLIALKKFIASSSRYLVFEQNTLQTRDRFLSIVSPYLESVQQRQGLYAFRVQMDESNNTPTVVDRNQLVGAIYLQPAKTAEFIILDFNILPTGATFPS